MARCRYRPTRTHGHLERLVEGFAEEERHGALRRDCFGRRRDPRSLYVVKRDIGYLVCDVEVSDERPVCRGHFLLPVLHLPARTHGELHVALPCTEPHLAHDHVLEHARVFAHHAELGAFGTSPQRRELEAPLALSVSRSRNRLPRERHGHLLARRGLSPHGHGLSLLEYHVVPEHARHRHRRHALRCDERCHNPH